MGLKGDWACDHITVRVRFRITGYLTSTTATSDAATNPCRWFRIQVSVF